MQNHASKNHVAMKRDFNDYIDYIDDSDFGEPGAQLTQQNTRLLKKQSARKPTKNDIWIYEIHVILRFTVP